jgi:hypothetical protein
LFEFINEKFIAMKLQISEQESILRQFRTLPSVGKAVSLDLWNMGFRNVNELKGQNPMKLYEKLNHITGMKHDICMLYTFRCIVHFVTEKQHDKEKLNWWYWKDNTYNE